MTSRVPPDVARVGELLRQRAGGYLRNTVREPGTTCEVCSTPVEFPYTECRACDLNERTGYPLADRVASLVYAILPSSAGVHQTYTAMRGYKADDPQQQHVEVVTSLLVLGLRGHQACDLALAGASEMRWATVPSTKNPEREHPLHRILGALATDPGLEIPVSPAQAIADARAVNPANYIIGSPIPPECHVVVVDDSWVTGGHAQSVASALRLAGARSVSILTVARVLNYGWAPTQRFINDRLRGGDFDYMQCPWTGGACPA